MSAGPIRCVRCGEPAEVRGRLNPELHRVLYLCDDLCPRCTEDLHEWWMLPPGARRRAGEHPRLADDRPPLRTRRYRW